LANSIIHPELAKHFLEWRERQQHHPMVVIDAALLIEAGFNKWVDKVVTVYAPKEVRLQRTIARDRSSAEQVEARMSYQLPEEEKDKTFRFYHLQRQPSLSDPASIGCDTEGEQKSCFLKNIPVNLPS